MTHNRKNSLIRIARLRQLILHGLHLVLLVLIVLVPGAQSECPPIHVFTGEAAWDFFGSAVASAGDVNNDGYDDLIVGAWHNEALGTRTGRAWVFSGLNGDTLYIFTGETNENQFGSSVASAGDVNGDGYDDLIVGAPNWSGTGFDVGRAYVFSGLDGDTLYVFTGESAHNFLGKSVASAGDVNNDGYDDVIIGAHMNSAVDFNAGRAYVFSGIDGDTLHIFSGEAFNDRFGTSVSSAGDVNNDGYDDLIIGAFDNDAGGVAAGRAYVFSGLNGDTLYVFTGATAYDSFGNSVSTAGDINNDGFADIVIGAPGNDAAGTTAGKVYVFSGLNGDTLYTYTGEAAFDNFGNEVASAGDVNSDGFSDFLVGAWPNDAGGLDAGRAYVFSGINGETLQVFTGEAPHDAFGISVSSAGDVNNDGIADFIIGADGNDAGGIWAGRAYVYSGAPCCCVGSTGNIDCDPNSIVDITDLTVLIDHLFISLNPLCCRAEGNVNGDKLGEVTITDLTVLINHLFITLLPTSVCQ